MKTAFNISGNLTTFLASVIAGNIPTESNPIINHFLYYWQAQNGFAWAFSDGGYSITVATPFAGNPNVTFDGTSLQFERFTYENKSGAEDSKANITCYPNSDATNLSTTVSFFSMAQDGLFDGSVLYIFRYIYCPTQNVLGLVKEFVGWIGQAKVSRDKMSFEVNSIFQQLNLRLPKRMYSPACTHALYDIGCGVSRAVYTFPLVISGVDSIIPQQRIYMTQYPAVPVGSFNLGTATFTSGLNVGITSTIRNDSGSSFLLGTALPNTPSIGDTYTANFGCDKTIATCVQRFNNFYGFNGFPFIPQEQILF